MAALYIVLVVMIIGALVAVEARELLSSVVAVGVVGLGLSLICILLRAPDVAITQLVVEIIAVVLLIRATLRRGLPRSPTDSRWVTGAAAVVFVLVMLSVAWSGFRELPLFGRPEMATSSYYVANALRDTGATNFVASILLDYRAYDTLGETTVLFAAVIGVLAVVRGVGRKETDARMGAEDE